MPDQFLLILFAMLGAVLVWGVWIGPWLRQRGSANVDVDRASVEGSSFHLMALGDGSSHSAGDSNDCSPADGAGSADAGCDAGGGGGDGGGGGGGD